MKSRVAKPSDSSSAIAFEAQYVNPKPGRTLIAGSRVFGFREDRRARYTDALGVDMSKGPGVDLVWDLEEPGDLGQFAHIECRSVLEHSRRPWLLAQNLVSMLEPGGTLHLAVPFCWRVHAYPDDYWRFTISGVRALFPGIRWEALMYAGQHLTTDDPPRAKVDGWTYLQRTEVVGFGVRA